MISMSSLVSYVLNPFRLHHQPVFQRVHNDLQRPRTGGDGALLPDGVGHRYLGLHEVQADEGQQPGRPDGGHSTGQQRDQPAGGSLHHHR